ncbi:hypothetical protein QQ045_020676 [Rhodiola kirilowii]
MEEHAEYYVKLLMAEEAAVKHLEEAGEAAIEKKETARFPTKRKPVKSVYKTASKSVKN